MLNPNWLSGPVFSTQRLLIMVDKEAVPVRVLTILTLSATIVVFNPFY